MNKNATIRQQLDNKLKALKPLESLGRPQKGWLRAIRDALGMSGRQLAQRLGVERQRVDKMEKSETQDAITLRTLRNAAKALDCTFVYGFIPNKSLEETVRKQAERVAHKREDRVSHTMRLENQELDQKEKNDLREEEVEKLLREMPRTLWNEI